MASKLVTYGAAVAGAAILPAAGKAIGSIASAASSGFSTGGITGAVDAASSAASSAGSSALGSIAGTFTSTSFLTSAGVGLAGMLLGSGSKRPSLSFPSLAASSIVALNISDLLNQGKAAAADIASRVPVGGALTGVAKFTIPTPSYPDATIAGASIQYQTQQLQYPYDLTARYWLKFSLYKYSRSLTQEDASSISSNPHTVIKLPFPTNVVDTIALSYDVGSLGMFGGPILNGVDQAYQQLKKKEDFARVAGGAVKSMTNAMKQDGFLEAVIRKALTNTQLGNAVGLVTGNAPNPHLAVSFNGVNLKVYNFTWRFSPNNLTESKTLENIMKQLQAASLPLKDGKFLLTFPNIVKVDLSPSNLITFKPCAIDSIAINYVPNGTPSFFKGDDVDRRYPTEIEMSITLRELDIHTASDNWYKDTNAAKLASDSASVGQDTDVQGLMTTTPASQGGLVIRG
jgi:hypothetical protein